VSRLKKPPALLQVADVLQRARRLPVGTARNDLRQLARGLLKLYRAGIHIDVQTVEKLTRA
jgi:hypothetical protein